MSVDPIRRALAELGDRRDLSADLATDAFAAIVRGEATEPAIAALLTALRVKGETAEELAGAVRATREAMIPAEAPAGALDTCGTGGDGARTLNISTAAAIVAAACGVPVVKHGNRSASGNSGSAEVLTTLGVDIEAHPATVRRCLDELGITFYHAPRHHPALRHAAAVRRQLPFRTILNLVGPLANPSRPPYQLVGVPTAGQADLVAGALLRLGVGRAAVVTGSDGLDEVTLAGPTRVLWVQGATIAEHTWTPESFGLPARSASTLAVDGPEASAARIRSLLAGEPGVARDYVLANAAASLLVAGRAASLAEGASLAAAAVDEGRAAQLLARWASMSRCESP